MARKQQAKARGSAKATPKATGKARKTERESSVVEQISDLLPSMPKSVGDVGQQIAKVLETDAGRFILAELLIYTAKALTRSMPSREQLAEAGSAVVDAGEAAVEAGARATTTAKDVASDLVQVAASAAGKVAAQAAETIMPESMKRGRRSSTRSEEPAGAEGEADAAVGELAVAGRRGRR